MKNPKKMNPRTKQKKMSKILGIECAGESLSVALTNNEEILSYRKITQNSGYPEIMVPLIQEVMSEAKEDFTELDIVAAGGGAGSFTGIRIALAVAGGIAMVTGCRATAISNFFASAFMVPKDEREKAAAIVAVLETRRADFYVQMFDNNLQPLTNPVALPADEIALPKGSVLLAGDAAERLYNELPTEVKTTAKVVPNTTPDAAVIAEVAEFLGNNLPALSPTYVTPAHVTCKS